MTQKLVTNGRTDIEDFFRLSGIRETKKLNHTPFLVFIESEDKIEVQIVDSADKLLRYPDETKVMAQWRGEWRSDFFQFSVSQFRKYVIDNPPKPHYIV
jgi:hypothetical protein